MPVQDSVVIRVDVDVHDGDLDELERRFRNLDKESRRFADRIGDSRRESDRFSRSLNRANTRLGSHDRHMDRINHRHRRFARTLDRAIAPLKKFITTLSKLSFVALIGQIGLFTIGLLSAKLALITGRAAVQVYQIALKGLSVTAAGVATAVSVAAAAMRQFNEAMLIPSVGGGMTRRGAQNSALLSRSLGSRTTGLLGGEATTALLAGLAKAGVSPTASGGIARQLINLTGGDAAAVQSIAKAIGSKDSAELRSALSGAAGFRSGSLQEGLSTTQLLAALSSGSIVSENYRGVGAGLAGTFIGTAKTEFSGMKNMFADMGQPLLNPFRDAMMDMARIIRENFLGMSLLIQRFGADSFAPTLVTLVEKTMDFIRSNIFDHLENIEQMGESFVGFFRSVRDFFHGIGAFLVQFEPAADVVIEMFRAMGATGGGRGLFRSFSDLIVKNAEAFQTFGASIGNVFGALFDLLKSGQTGFFGRLELFSEIMNTIAAKIIPAIGNLLESLVPILEQLPNAISGLAVVIETLVPVVARVADVFGAIMGSGGTAGGILGGLGLLALLKPGMALRMGRGAINAGRATPAFLGSTRGGSMVGGSLLFGAAVNNLSRGENAGMMTTASSMAGGAILGSLLLPGVGTAVGAAFGAAAGLFVNDLTRLLGERQRKGRVEDAVASALATDALTFTGTSLTDARQQRVQNDKIRAALGNMETKRTVIERNAFESFLAVGGRQVYVIDPGGANVQQLQAFAEQAYGMDFSDFTDEDFNAAFNRTDGYMYQRIADDMERLNSELVRFEGSVDMLGRTTGMTEEEVSNFADRIGIDLFNSTLNAAGATAVFAAQMLPLIDRNRAFLPDFATSPLGQSEARATANAAFTALANADTLTVDLVRDAFEAFTAYEVAMGVSPDVAGFSSNFELMEQVMGNLSPDNQRVLRGMLAAGTLESATAMSQAYGIPLERIMQFAGGDRIIGTPGTGELRDIETFLADRSAIRGALNLSSGLTGSQRFESLLAAEAAPTGAASRDLRQSLLSALGMSEILGRQFSTADLFEQVETTTDADTSSILLRSLSESGFFDTDETLSIERNTSLATIAEDIRHLRTEGITVTDGTYTPERGVVGSQLDLPGGP